MDITATCAVDSCSDSDTAQCTACPIGRKMEESNHQQSACETCPEGYVASLPGLTQCEICPEQLSTCPAEAEASGLTTLNSVIECPVGTTKTFCQKKNSCVKWSYCACAPGAVVKNDVCEACPIGQSSPPEDWPSYNCVRCYLGKYSSNPATSCQECPAGKATYRPKSSGTGYESIYNAPNCYACPAGQISSIFRELKTQYDTLYPKRGLTTLPDGEGLCTNGPCYGFSKGKCLPCAEGFFAKNGTTCDACPSGYFGNQIGVESCITCDVGKYSDEPSSTTCKSCAAGQSSVAAGQITCTNCLQGQYQPSDTDAGPCVDCVAGKYSSWDGPEFCLNCPESNTTGATSCPDGKCDTGKYTDSSTQECFPCLRGLYQDKRDQTECVQCPQGFHAHAAEPERRVDCEKCSAGKYGIAAGATDELTGCEKCSPGKYSSDMAADSSVACKQCPKGRWSDATGLSNQAECKSCDAGTYGASTGATDKASCTACEAGKFGEKVGGDSEESSCVDCPTGFFQQSLGKPFCLPCSRGKTSGTTGAITCSSCDAGKYMNETASTALECRWAPIGHYVTGGSTSTIAAPDGFKATECLNKQDAASPGCQSSVRCIAGKHATETKMSCRMCPSGFFSSPGKSSCDQCQLGKYAAENSPQLKSQCNDCPRGWMQDQIQAISCVKCVPGQISVNLGLSSCTLCDPGTFAVSDGAFRCLKCPKGFAQSRQGAALCQACLSGTASVSNGSEICTSCRAGSYSSKKGSPDCYACPLGFSQRNPSATKCDRCPGGKVATAEGSVTCSEVLPDTSVASPIISAMRPNSTFGNALVLEIDLSSIPSTHSGIQIQTSILKNFRNVIEDKFVLLKDVPTSSRLKSNPNVAVFSLRAMTSPVWSSNIFVRAAAVKSDGRYGMWSAVNDELQIVSECSFNTYLKTHANDNLCVSEEGEPTELDLLNASQVECVRCPAGGACEGETFVWNIAPKAGWWIVPWSDSKSTPVYSECPLKGSCIGARHDASGCTRSTCDMYDSERGWWPAGEHLETKYLNTYHNQSAVCGSPRLVSNCSFGYVGPLCAVCADRFTRVRGKCTECDTGVQVLLLIVSTGIGLIIFFLVTRYLKKAGKAVGTTRRDITRIVIISLNLAQIQNSVKSIMDGVVWPDNVLAFFDNFNWVDLDLASLTGATCASSVNFNVRFAFMAAIPFLVIVVAFLQYKRGEANIAKKIRKTKRLTAKERKAEYKLCHGELFDMVDVDRSGSLDAGELADLTKLVGLNTPDHPITQGIALRLIQQLCHSNYATEFDKSVYLDAVISGNLTKELEIIFIRQQKKPKQKKKRVSIFAKFTRGNTLEKKNQVVTSFGSAPTAGKAGRSGQPTKMASSMLHNNEEAHDQLVAWNNHRKLVASSWSWPSQVLMLLHTPISRKVFHYFDVDNIGESPNCDPNKNCKHFRGFLRADYKIQVSENGEWTSSYQQFLVVVLFVLIFYTLAFPAVIGGFIFQNRANLYNPKVTQRFGWMYSRLTRGAEFWEVHEMFRKMMLTGIMVFAPRNKSIRAALSLLICIIAQINLNYFRPYRSTIVFWVEQGAYSMALMLYMCSILFSDNVDAYQKGWIAWLFISINAIYWLFALSAIGLKLYMLKLHLDEEKNPVQTSTLAHTHSVLRNQPFVQHKQGDDVPKVSFGRTKSGVKLSSHFKNTVQTAVHFERGLQNISKHAGTKAARHKKIEQQRANATSKLEKRLNKRNKTKFSALRSAVLIVPSSSKHVDASGKHVMVIKEIQGTTDQIRTAMIAAIKTPKKLHAVFTKLAKKNHSSGLSEKAFNKLVVASAKKVGFSPEASVLKKAWEEVGAWDEVGAHSVGNHQFDEVDVANLENWLWHEDN